MINQKIKMLKEQADHTLNSLADLKRTLLSIKKDIERCAYTLCWIKCKEGVSICEGCLLRRALDRLERIT